MRSLSIIPLPPSQLLQTDVEYRPFNTTHLSIRESRMIDSSNVSREERYI